MTTLEPKDVPGAIFRNDIPIEDHSVLELQRWLECRGYKRNGTKKELITRVKNCINAGKENIIFLGIDGGKWYDMKNNIVHISGQSSTNSQAANLLWRSFPSCDIPQYYNKGHIYTFIVGENIETEDPETTELNPRNNHSTTVKPFKKGSQYVSSDHISEIEDGRQGYLYFCKSKCLSSFQKTVKYNVLVTINIISGAVIEGSCECKQSAMGKCTHVTALLLFLWEYVEQYGHNRLSCTSLPRQWGLGSKKRNPMPIISAEYPIKRYRPLTRAIFDPRPVGYVRNINVNNFIVNLQKVGDGSCFQSVLKLEYEDFEYSNEELCILKLQTSQFLESMKNISDLQETILFEVPGTSPQGTDDWLKWRTYYITSSNVKLVVTQLHSENAKKNFLLKNLWLHSIPFQTGPMHYGKENEQKARKRYAATFLQENQNMIEVGLLVNSDYPHLAASLDGVVMDGDEIHHIIEIKCPKVLENCNNITEFDTILSKSQLSNFFLQKKGGKIFIRENHPYLYQILTSLIILRTDICNLVVWSPKSILVIPVHKQKYLNIVEEIKEKTHFFYCNIYVPEIFAMRTVRGLCPINLDSD